MATLIVRLAAATPLSFLRRRVLRPGKAEKLGGHLDVVDLAGMGLRPGHQLLVTVAGRLEAAVAADDPHLLDSGERV